jgi:hypothetical protein
MDDLDPIVVVKLCRAPIVAAHDGTVQFDCDSRGRQVKLGDQAGEEKRTGELSGFAVYVNAQRLQASASGVAHRQAAG